MPRRLLSAAAVCTLLLGLAACGEGGEGPVTTPPPKIDISGPSDGGGDSGPSDGGGDEASPNAAPDVPAPDPADYPGMDENTPEGAEQAFRYYIATVYWSHETGDIGALSNLYRETCQSCVDIADEVDALREDGVLWSGVSVTDAWSEPHSSEAFDSEVSYGFTLEPHTRPLEPEGGYESEGTDMTAIAGMDWVDGGWVVGGMQIGVSENG